MNGRIFSFSGQYIGENPQQLERINVYFTEASQKNYVPRAVLVKFVKKKKISE